MPLQLNFSDNEVIGDSLATLQKASIAISAHRANESDRFRGKSVSSGTYRGTVVSVGKDSLNLQSEDGTKKSIPLTSSRARQLLAGDTSRK